MTGFAGAILARDPEGEEHLLQVTERPSGLIEIGDDAMVRVLPVMVALELAWVIIQAATRLRRIEGGEAGPLSSTF
jgi:hypothetical protein